MANKSLSSKNIEDIKSVLSSWNSKLTWALLVKRISVELGIKRSRVTLQDYPSIYEEFTTAKKRLRGYNAQARANARTKNVKSVKSDSKFVEFTQSQVDQFKRIKTLEADNARLRREATQHMGFVNTLLKESENHPLLMEVLRTLKRKAKAASSKGSN